MARGIPDAARERGVLVQPVPTVAAEAGVVLTLFFCVLAISFSISEMRTSRDMFAEASSRATAPMNVKKLPARQCPGSRRAIAHNSCTTRWLERAYLHPINFGERVRLHRNCRGKYTSGVCRDSHSSPGSRAPKPDACGLLPREPGESSDDLVYVTPIACVGVWRLNTAVANPSINV